MYTVKELDSQRQHYLVSVFDGDQIPNHTYQVWLGSRKHCTCLGYRKTPGAQHKHLQIVRYWLDHGSPWFSALEINEDGNIQLFAPYTPEKSK